MVIFLSTLTQDIGATANMNSADKQIECGKVDEFSVLFYRSTIFGSFDNHLEN